MADIDFYMLPRAVQDRLLSSFNREYEPKPILFVPGVRPTALRWAAIAPVSVSALAALCLIGLGDAHSALSRHPWALVALYVALAGLAALGVIQSLAYRARVAVLPFHKGVYLFPAVLIDAREARLGVQPLTAMREVVTESGKVILVFPKQRYVFLVESGHEERAAGIVRQLKESALADLPDEERRDLDPLVPPAVVSPLATDVPLAPRYPAWLPLRWIPVGVVALLGVGVFMLRDDASDRRMFEAAKAHDDVASYQRYLERGDAHREVVARELLPRAELRLAIAEGTVDAIDALVARFPDTAIGAEIDAARKAALAAAFAEAKAQGTLLALMKYDERYPGHHLGADLAAARHAIYQKVLADHAAKKPAAGDATAAWIEKVLAHAEEVGPKRDGDGLLGPDVELRLRRVPAKAMDLADDQVKKNPYYTGEPSIPSRHLEPAKVEPRATAAIEALASAFAEQFPKDIIGFRVAEPLDGSAPLPEVKAPTLVMSYRIEPTGANYASRKPRGIFVGLGFFFRVDLLMPGEEATTLNLVVEQPVLVDLLQNHEAGSGRVEPKLYDAMVEKAFAKHRKLFLAQWFESK